MSPLTLSAPPKVNLFLHITGQRDDGYHNLQTLFQLLDGGDQLTFNTTDNAELSLWPQIEGVAEQDNLIIRAARALQQQTGCTQGCSIELHKRLPMGAGLGGRQQQCGNHTVGAKQPLELQPLDCRTG